MRYGLMLVAVCSLLVTDALAKSGTCSGCSCRGGTSYRSIGGCVKESALKRVCGTPPTTRCKYDGRTPPGEKTATPTAR